MLQIIKLIKNSTFNNSTKVDQVPITMGVPRLSAGDPGSYSNPDQAIVQHMDIHYDVDFNKSIFDSVVTLTVYLKSNDVKELILDTRNLNIKKIIYEENKSELKYSLDNPVHTFGSKLTINLPHTTAKRILIKIEFETNPKSTALQWLKPGQTAGKRHPYVFSQCQPDHCRSILPCQDTPSVKGTYRATVTVPEEFVALMSAVKEKEPTSLPNGKKKFFFNQTVPIPAYLVAIAVGNLESRQLGPRSSVWSEPEILEKAAYEFAETEIMLKTAEDICGPYVWKIYDLLVLPPSFPFGGMENPCLTFITPTLLTGDRSMVSVVAHEISHSWTGNLISIKNFEHFWLNEGFTTFIERKINGRLKGEAYRHFCAIGGLKDLKQSIKTLGKDNPFTKLVVDLTGVDPDDAFSTCPYEKGHTFLFYLEELVGGANKFDSFLRSYFNEFKNQSVDTDDFKNYLLKYFSTEEKLAKIDWDAWLFSTGMPPYIPAYDPKMQEMVVKLVDIWINVKTDDKLPTDANDFKSLIPEQVEEFCALLLEREPLPLDRLKKLDHLYNLSSIKNTEIKFRWLRLCIRSRWEEKMDEALEFATEQGRMKYVRPIFRDLFGWKKSRDKAIQKFNEHKSSMMHVLTRNLDQDLENTIVTS